MAMEFGSSQSRPWTRISHSCPGGITSSLFSAPRWVLSMLLPSEFKRWRASVLRRCKQLSERVPCSRLWDAETSVAVKEVDEAVELSPCSTGISDGYSQPVLMDEPAVSVCCGC